MTHFAIFGIHPRLSLAEFRAVMPSAPIPVLAGQAAIFDTDDWNGALLMDRLGGTVKLGDVHEEMAVTDLTAAKIADLIEKLPRGDRAIFGYTVYGSGGERKWLDKLPLELKRELKTRGKSARWVTSEGDAPLSPAAVAKLHLTTEGYDIALLLHGGRVSIGLTTHVQNADAWSERDYGRPQRDDENGMLPPKLARIMVNLAQVKDGGTLADPFCGSGTVLMEAALVTKAAKIIGSDDDKKQVEMSRLNTDWLIEKGILKADDKDRFEYFVADAREFKKHSSVSLDAVVTEGYLGPALRGYETQANLTKNAEEIKTLWKDTLKELAPLLTKGARIVGVWPAMKTDNGVARVDLADDVAELGYRLTQPLQGWEKEDGPLLYSRVGQRVMRRIVILEREG